MHRVLSGPVERFSVPFFQGVRGDLTKSEAVGTLKKWSEKFEIEHKGEESAERKEIDSPFLKGSYETWGESQLRIKVRSHRETGRKFYPDVCDKYFNDD